MRLQGQNSPEQYLVADLLSKMLRYEFQDAYKLFKVRDTSIVKRIHLWLRIVSNMEIFDQTINVGFLYC